MRRFKDSILKDKKFLREMAVILIVGIIINVACFFLCSFTGHCINESSQYFPMTQNDKNFPMSEIYNYISFEFDNNENLNDYYCFMTCKDDISGRYHGYIIFTDDMWLAEQSSSGSSFNVQASTVQNVFYAYEYSCSNTFSWRNVYNRGTNTIRGLVLESSLADQHSSYLSNFQVGFYVYDYACLIGPDNSVSVGDFTDLPSIDEILNNISNIWEPPSTTTGHALPSQPTENPNNSPFQDRLQMFDYIKNDIDANFGNLGYNLSKWFNSVLGKLVEGFNSVSQNIWNGFKTLMDNIKDFFGPKIDAIIEKFNYITEEPDSEQIIDFIETTSIYSDISSINTSVSTFGSSFTGVSEPDDYTITFHIEDIDILNQSYPFVLHLNILNPIKSTLRAFLWVIVSYGLFISVVDSLPNYINGGGGEDD